MPRRKILPGAPPRSKVGRLRHSRHPEHVELCTECRSALNRERQYLERLRDAAVPEASADLTRRLLQQTQQLADEAAVPEPREARAPWRSIRIAGIAAGTVAMSTGALAFSAYAVAGDAVTDAGTAGESIGSSMAAAVVGGPAELVTSGPVAEPPVVLGPAELDLLRSQGWACPELSEMGFKVVSARVTVHNGHPAVELRLEDGSHHATVVEEHLPATQVAARPSTSAQLSVSQGNPWKAVYRTAAGVLSYTSDLPAEKADDAVPELVRAADAMASEPVSGSSESWFERLLRGLRTLIHPAGL
jgi:hypothetical protein